MYNHEHVWCSVMRLIHTTCYPMNCHCTTVVVLCSCCKSSRSFTKAAASFFSFPPPPTRSYFGPSSFPKRETTILAQLCGHRDSYLAPFPMPPIFIGRSFSFAASEDLKYWGHSWIRILALSGMSYESKKMLNFSATYRHFFVRLNELNRVSN